jgi:hypothetical protein
MTTDDFLYKQYHLSVLTGTNQRYHQEYASWWIGADRAAKIVVGVLAIGGACASVVTASLESVRWDIAGIAVAVLAAIAGIVLNVLPFGDWASRHIALFQRWTDLREDVDALLFDLKGDPSAPIVERLKQLDAKVHRICGTEPAPKKSMLVRCQHDEERSRPNGAACAA